MLPSMFLVVPFSSGPQRELEVRSKKESVPVFQPPVNLQYEFLKLHPSSVSPLTPPFPRGEGVHKPVKMFHLYNTTGYCPIHKRPSLYIT